MMRAQITPELVELVRVVFYGLSILCIPLATAVLLFMNNRQKKIDIKTDALNTKIDGLLVERDAAKVREGEQKGEDKAEALAAGQKQGLEMAEKARAESDVDRVRSSNKPLPVEDEAAAKISRDIAKSTAESAAETAQINLRVASATEKSAAATEKIAEATEKKS